MSAIKVGLAAEASDSVAALPTGRVVSAHENVRDDPSGSSDPDPSSCTVAPSAAAASSPAWATGAEFCVEIETVSGPLFTVPSLTISCAT